MSYPNISIKSLTKNYEVEFIQDQLALIDKIKHLDNAIIIVDNAIATHYPQLVATLGQKFPILTLEATEENKTIRGMETVLAFLQQHNATRSTTIVAFGGGIVQDIASFAAHLYYRGLQFYFIPTTLLAICDSCIGSKCGLNFQGFKNQIGAYIAPEKIFIWTGFLSSLSEIELYSGYGEMLKFMLTDGQQTYDDFKFAFVNGKIDTSTAQKLIFESLQVKKRFIEEDEFDKGVRNILNYGHTFGHSLELVTQYQIAHGIAVARGIDIANYISYRKGFLDLPTYNEIHEFIQANFQCNHRPLVNAEELIANTKRDKKVSGGKLKMVLLEEPGKLRIEPISFDNELTLIIEEYIKTNTSMYTIKKEVKEKHL